MNIIFLDDDPTEAERFEDMMRNIAGQHQIYAFCTEADTLRFAERQKADIAFLAIHMPSADGIDIARQLLDIQPELHFVFLSEDAKDALRAFEVCADGYIIKPYDCEVLQKELEKIKKKYKIPSERKVYFQTMPRFELFVDGQLIPISKRKIKEFLALLVDQRGNSISSSKAIACLWENRPEDASTKALLRMTAKRLRDFLAQEQLEDILLDEHGVRAIVYGRVRCDYYDLLSGSKTAIANYQGEYMTEYPWAKRTNTKIRELVQGRLAQSL